VSFVVVSRAVVYMDVGIGAMSTLSATNWPSGETIAKRIGFASVSDGDQLAGGPDLPGAVDQRRGGQRAGADVVGVQQLELHPDALRFEPGQLRTAVIARQDETTWATRYGSAGPIAKRSRCRSQVDPHSQTERCSVSPW